MGSASDRAYNWGYAGCSYAHGIATFVFHPLDSSDVSHAQRRLQFDPRKT